MGASEGAAPRATHEGTHSATQAPNASQHAGWLRLGQPGLRTPMPLPAERFVEPAAGRMVLFPAYMWHGVEPFQVLPVHDRVDR